MINSSWQDPSILNPFCEAMLRAIAFRDPVTHDHSKRVGELAVMFALEINAFTEERLNILKWAALLHDVGKIFIKDSVLDKSKALNDGEWAMMRQHTRLGYQLLAPLGTWHDISAVALYHHENYDGTGYPEKIKGEDIPFMARIICVVDKFEALTAFRSYRDIHEYSQAEALDMMQAHPESYDPFLLREFVHMIERRSKA